MTHQVDPIRSPIFSSNITTKKLEDDKKNPESKHDSLINIINKIQEQQNEINKTAMETHEKVRYLSSKQVIGFSFFVGICASLVASGFFFIFTNLIP